MQDITPPNLKDIAKRNVLIVYILYLVGILVPLTTIIGLVMAYMNRSDADTWLAEHYQYQIRTFWIGLFYGVICVVSSFVLIGFVMGGLLIIWYIARCIKGIKYLDRSEGVPGVTNWII